MAPGSHTCQGHCPRLRTRGHLKFPKRGKTPAAAANPKQLCLRGRFSGGYPSGPPDLASSRGQPGLGLGDLAPDPAALERERRKAGACIRASEEVDGQVVAQLWAPGQQSWAGPGSAASLSGLPWLWNSGCRGSAQERFQALGDRAGDLGLSRRQQEVAQAAEGTVECWLSGC